MSLRPVILMLMLTVFCFLGKTQENKMRLSAIPFPLELKNDAISVELAGDSILKISAAGNTNLFVSPSGNYNQQNAPMVLFQPDSSFVFSAKVSGNLKEVYDVGALVIFQDSAYWSKFCYEYSVQKEPTIVSVVTRKFSDDCNSFSIDQDFAYMAIIKKGLEISFHYSVDGDEWELIRHFCLESEDNLKIGFVVHGSQGDGFSAHFSNIRYTSKVVDNLRYL